MLNQRSLKNETKLLSAIHHITSELKQLHCLGYGIHVTGNPLEELYSKKKNLP
jgi:hypothetical protein